MSQTEKEEKKKGAAPVPAGGGGAGSSFSLEQLESLQNVLSQVGGAGSAAGSAAAGGGVAAAVASKVGVILVVAMLGAGAMNMRSNQLKLGMKQQRSAAAKPHYEGDLSNLPTNPEQPDAIQGVVIGDMTRKGDEAAAEAAAAEAAAKAQADAQASAAAPKGDEVDQAGAAVKAAMSATPAMKAGDLTAKAAKLPLGKGNGPFDKKFGALSSNLGGGSSGASSGASFKPAAAAAGESKGMGAGPKAPSGMKALGTKGGGRGGRAFGQLLNINGLSRQGAKVGGEGGSSLADRGFSNGGGGGSAITGGGAGITGQGVFIAHHDTNPNGTPINNHGPEGTQAPPTAGHKNATPWQADVDRAIMAMALAVLMLTATYLLAQQAKEVAAANALDGGAAAAPWLLAAKICAGIAIAAAGWALVEGAIIMGQGQKMQGMMFIAGGALVGVLAGLQLVSEIDQSNQAKMALWAGPDGPAAASAGGGAVSGGGGSVAGGGTMVSDGAPSAAGDLLS